MMKGILIEDGRFGSIPTAEEDPKSLSDSEEVSGKDENVGGGVVKETF